MSMVSISNKTADTSSRVAVGATEETDLFEDGATLPAGGSLSSRHAEALKSISTPGNSTVTYARAIVFFGRSNTPESELVLKDILLGKYSHLNDKQRESAGMLLFLKSPENFIAFAAELNPNSSERLIATRALGHEITRETLRTLVTTASDGNFNLSYEALSALERGLGKSNDWRTWTTTRSEAIHDLMLLAKKLDGASRQEFSEAATVDIDPDAFRPLSDYERSLKLKAVLVSLSDGLDRVLAVYVKNAKRVVDCSLAFEILANRKSPELKRLIGEMISNPKTPKEIISLFANDAWACSGHSETARERVERSLPNRIGNFIRSIKFPVPAFLDPRVSSLTFGEIYRSFVLGQMGR